MLPTGCHYPSPWLKISRIWFCCRDSVPDPLGKLTALSDLLSRHGLLTGGEGKERIKRVWVDKEKLRKKVRGEGRGIGTRRVGCVHPP